MEDMNTEHKVLITKTGRPDKRSLTSKMNAKKAGMKKLEKLAEKKRQQAEQMRIISEERKKLRAKQSGSESDSDSSGSESEKEFDILPRRKPGRPKKIQGDAETGLLGELLAQTLKVVDERELKKQQEKKAKAKAKREAIKQAKAAGTYQAKGRGRPAKQVEKPTAPVELKEKPATPEKAEIPTTYISW